MLDNLGKGIGVDKVNTGEAIISTKWCYVPKEGSLVKEQTTPLGDWLKETRKREGLSFRQVAAKTGLSHATSCQDVYTDFQS